ncbi:MAG: hypothetical protein QOG94_379 [Solirubrobacteraceae bacterium]|jgi:hypothetical protein|nr:hypothetical protein [Solirubrobacteraceae bacterium]MEA2139630.1 hypothetical protein [Solirubrobacteraceae bacterium]
MPVDSPATWMIEQEALALLARLDSVKPFSLLETMLPAAALSPVAQVAIDRFLVEEREALRVDVGAFVAWLRGPGRAASAQAQQRRFVMIRLRFNTTLSHLDMFCDAISQRSENATGVLLSGLEVAAAEALSLPGGFYDDPPMICYLDRGPGAAIRRARTRLPGGRSNPVAMIRVPRERMVGNGIASSLFHEVGHQGAALLGLVDSVREALNVRIAHTRTPRERAAWTLWSRWISEIIADFWAIGRVGITSTLGLLAVVSLPGYFVFRINTDDPHPTPWVRVMLSCTIGQALFPHPQWARLAACWQAFYPLHTTNDDVRAVIEDLLATMPELAGLLAEHRPPSLRGHTLREVLRSPGMEAHRLLAILDEWRLEPRRMRDASPVLVFAVCGQARIAGRLGALEESRLLTRLIIRWALRSTDDITALCALRSDADAPRRVRPLPATASVPAH